MFWKWAVLIKTVISFLKVFQLVEEKFHWHILFRKQQGSNYQSVTET
jgi:hypothetical protein